MKNNGNGPFFEAASIDLSILIVTRNRQEMLKDCIDSLLPALSGVSAADVSSNAVSSAQPTSALSAASSTIDSSNVVSSNITSSAQPDSVTISSDQPDQPDPAIDLSYEIIVVDNCSEDETLAMLNGNFPDVRIVENEYNNGVAPARNQALNIARGRYLLIFDDDAKLPPGQNFRELLDHMDRHPEIGILGCESLAPDGTINISKRTFAVPIHVILRRLRDVPRFRARVDATKTLQLHHLEGHNFTEPTEVNFLEGFFMLIRRQMLEKTGLLDERMFYGFEDADICARAQKAGYKVVFYPGFKAYHLVSAITRKKGSLKLLVKHSLSFLRYYLKHRKWVIQKNCEMLSKMGLLKNDTHQQSER